MAVKLLYELQLKQMYTVQRGERNPGKNKVGFLHLHTIYLPVPLPVPLQERHLILGK